MQILSKRSVAMFVGIAALIAASAASAQTTEPVIGTWKLDVAKSTYKPGPAPKSSTLTIEPAGTGLKVAIDAVNADGSPLKWGFTTMRDGKEEAPVTGHPMFDVVTSTRTNATAGTNVYRKGGKVVMTTNLAISPDGKTMTLTSTGTDPKGQAIHNVAIYTK
jgi:hypothetical protein